MKSFKFKFLWTLQKYLLFYLIIFSSGQINNAQEDSDAEWSYDNPEAWGDDYSTCDGYRQSPIYLGSEISIPLPTLPLRFENYNISLRGPLTITNNGHSVNIDIPRTRNGYRPSITGGKLLSRYEAQSLHFHWGSRSSEGSEHVIDGRRYDVEMHIVHKNVLYGTVAEATQYSDGLAVLGIMIEKNNQAQNLYPALYKIFQKLPQIIEYNSNARINNAFALSNLLGDLYTNEFYTYKGSLTTPPCSEAVTWFVFPDPIPIRISEINKFYNLDDSHNETLIDNYRPLQPLNGRKVFYRYNGDLFPSLPFEVIDNF